MKHLLPSFFLSLLLFVGCDCPGNTMYPSTAPYEGYTGNGLNSIVIKVGDSICQRNTLVHAFVDGLPIYRSHVLPLKINVNSLEHRIDVWTAPGSSGQSSAMEFSGMVQINRDTTITLTCP